MVDTPITKKSPTYLNSSTSSSVEPMVDHTLCNLPAVPRDPGAQTSSHPEQLQPISILLFIQILKI